MIEGGAAGPLQVRRRHKGAGAGDAFIVPKAAGLELHMSRQPAPRVFYLLKAHAASSYAALAQLIP